MSKKIIISKEDIQAEYLDKAVGMVEASLKLGCSVPILRKYIRLYGMVAKYKTWNVEAFKTNHYLVPIKLIPREKLESVYINSPISYREAIAILGTSWDVFERSMKEYGFPRKTKTWASGNRTSCYPLFNDKDAFLKELETKTMTKVSEELGCSKYIVQYYAKKYGFTS